MTSHFGFYLKGRFERGEDGQSSAFVDKSSRRAALYKRKALVTTHKGSRNATTKLNQTTVNTKPNHGMKNAMPWESLLNALSCEYPKFLSF